MHPTMRRTCRRTRCRAWRGGPWPAPTGPRRRGRALALGPCRRGRLRRGRGLPRPRSGSSGSSFRPVSRLVPRVPRASERAARHRRPRGSRCRDPACGRARGPRRMPPRPRRAPPEWCAPLQCGKYGAERVGQGGEPGVEARLKDAGATGQGLPAVLGAGELGEDRLGPLAERGRLDGSGRCRPSG